MRSPTVLIAVVNRPHDLEIILKQKWYRIPVARMPVRKFEFIAFYQTSALGKHGGKIEYYGRVSKRTKVTRIELLPKEVYNPRAHNDYYKFAFRKITKLNKPIINKPGIRVNFGFASLYRLKRARTLARLYRIRQIEIVFRNLLKKHRIPFVAEYAIKKDGKVRYRLDFAFFCQKGNINVECDMRKFHRGIRQLRDSRRDRFMKSSGWKVLRFSDEQILGQPLQCISQLKSEIKSLGGVWSPRKLY
ncbi:MAG: DUF559 domain-containing protein [Pseudomonadota bacterium]